MQIGLVAEFKVPASNMERFLNAAHEELRAVRETEPGCLRFDIIVFDERDGRGAFVEVFADQAAAELHRELPQFGKFFGDIVDLEVQWTAKRGWAMVLD
jgi:quinol monooxygenase YgiN